MPPSNTTSSPIRNFALIILVTNLVGIGTAFASGAEELADYHKKTIKQKFELVKHIRAEQLVSLNADKTILFDVREPGEFAVSHLETAIRVSPGISQSDFINRYLAITTGKTLVFYCSVGYRSSALAEAVQNKLLRAGSKAIYNLEGGIFNWHNQNRPLINRSGASDYIHPYNEKWGHLLERTEKIRY